MSDGLFRFGGIRIDERGSGATGRGRETFYQSFSSTREFGQVDSSRIIATGLRKGRLAPATPSAPAHIGILDLYAVDGDIVDTWLVTTKDAWAWAAKACGLTFDFEESWHEDLL